MDKISGIHSPQRIWDVFQSRMYESDSRNVMFETQDNHSMMGLMKRTLDNASSCYQIAATEKHKHEGMLTKSTAFLYEDIMHKFAFKCMDSAKFLANAYLKINSNEKAIHYAAISQKFLERMGLSVIEMESYRRELSTIRKSAELKLSKRSG